MSAADKIIAGLEQAVAHSKGPQFTTEVEMRVSSLPSANNSFHLYLADKRGRKVGVCWGGSEEKLANGYLWSAAYMLFEAAQDTVEALSLLRVGLANDPKVVEVLDAHIEELQYALDHAVDSGRGQ